MSFSQIQLPDFLIADLYKQHLVVISAKTEEKQAPINGTENLEKNLPKEWFLGNNEKYITLLVNDKTATYLQDESLQLLSAMLNACKMNLGDVAIVNYQTEQIPYTELKAKLKPRHLILFDVTAKQVQLPFNVPFYQVQSYDGCQFLLAPSLETMLGTGQDAKLEKIKLWICLKKMFQV